MTNHLKPNLMQGKELLKYYKSLPEQKQTQVLVDAYNQIVALHDTGRSFDSFSWTDCTFENDCLTINASVDNYFNEESFQRNLLDYAGVIYCLTTGNKSSESMSWNAGRTIESNVLREIVLTICGRNNSIEPLLKKLRQPYTDEETFFDNYTTVDEKEGRDAAEKQRRIDEENRADNFEQQSLKNYMNLTSPKKSWFERFGIYILMVLCIGGYKACKASKEMERQQSIQQMQMMRQERQQLHKSLKDVRVKQPYRAKPTESDNNSDSNE